MSNSTLAASKPKFSTIIKSNTYQNLIKQTLGNPKKAERYTAAIMSAVATNPQLQNCEAKTILSGSLLAESLNLAHSPQLGQYYLVPFKVKAKNDIPEHYDAQFILGYKGYIQLATRSGNYKKINVMEIKDGELVSYDPFSEEIVLQPIQDVDEYINGFKKVIYWSKKQMLQHADKYSPAFSKSAYEKLRNGEIPNDEMWKYSSFWYKDFDGMAKKTLIRQLIGKWGVMSAEMTQAMELDNNSLSVEKNGFVTIEADVKTVDDTEDGTEDDTEEVNFDEV